MMCWLRGYRNRNSGSAKIGYYTISPNHSMYCMEKNTLTTWKWQFTVICTKSKRQHFFSGERPLLNNTVNNSAFQLLQRHTSVHKEWWCVAPLIDNKYDLCWPDQYLQQNCSELIFLKNKKRALPKAKNLLLTASLRQIWPSCQSQRGAHLFACGDWMSTGHR